MITCRKFLMQFYFLLEKIDVRNIKESIIEPNDLGIKCSLCLSGTTCSLSQIKC